jgi:hypothetical protein
MVIMAIMPSIAITMEGDSVAKIMGDSMVVPMANTKDIQAVKIIQMPMLAIHEHTESIQTLNNEFSD